MSYSGHQLINRHNRYEYNQYVTGYGAQTRYWSVATEVKQSLPAVELHVTWHANTFAMLEEYFVVEGFGKYLMVEQNHF